MLEEVLSLTEWKKKKQILSELSTKGHKISERSFRKKVEANNKLYVNGQTNYYIVHSCKGYKFSFNWDEIEKSIADKRKRALTMLTECSRAKAQFRIRNYIKMEEIYEEN